MIQHPYPSYVKIVVVRTNYANTNIILKTILELLYIFYSPSLIFIDTSCVSSLQLTNGK